MKKRNVAFGMLGAAMLAASVCGNGRICRAEENAAGDMVILDDINQQAVSDQLDAGSGQTDGGNVQPDIPQADAGNVPADIPQPDTGNIQPDVGDVPMDASDGEWNSFYEEDETEYLDEKPEIFQEEAMGSIHRISEFVKTIEEFEIGGKEEALRDFYLPDEIPSAASLDVPVIMQNPALPTGCEAVALTMALQYEGFDVDKIAIADEFLIYNNETDNMALGYVGDPFSEEGAGCFPSAIAATAEFFFEDQDVNYAAYNITGTTLEDLLPYIASGTPVMVWTTMYMAEPEFTREDSEYDGHIYQWYRQEHCVVLSGYDMSSGTLQINDPLEGLVERDFDEFNRIYTKTGENAVVLRSLEEETENIDVAANTTEESGEANCYNTEAGVY